MLDQTDFRLEEIAPRDLGQIRFYWRSILLPVFVQKKIAFTFSSRDAFWSAKLQYCGFVDSLLQTVEMLYHEQFNQKTKTKCCIFWCLIGFIDWRYSHWCWYFRPSLVNYCPSNLLSSSPPSPVPTSPFPCVKVQYLQSVCGWGGVELNWRPYSAGV